MAEVGTWFNISESTRVEWVSLGDIPRLIANGHITDADTLIALPLASTAPASQTARPDR